MLWLKRNLFFVLSMLVGLGAIGAAVYDYFSIRGANANVATNLRDRKSVV